MTRLKFRAFVKESKKMVNVRSIDLKSGFVFVGSRGIHAKGVELMQYTGAKDINGKEICEGDVVKAMRCDWIRTFEIEWNEDRCGFMVWDGFRTNLSFYLSPDSVLEHRIEVIGNIYESPELLERM